MKTFVRQHDSMDCGAACLAMITQHYGLRMNREKLRAACSMNRNGVSLLGISRAAEQIGFRTIGGSLSFEAFVRDVPLPCIAHWNQNHFVVIHRIKTQGKGEFSIHVADPGKGLIIYTRKEFCEHWCSTVADGKEKGIVLLLEPTERFYELLKNEGGEDRVMHSSHSRQSLLCAYLAKYKHFFIQLVLGLFLGSLLQLVFPLLTQGIVDIGIGGKDIRFVWLVLLAQLMLIFSRTAVDFVRAKILLHISTRINITLISDFFIKLMKLPMVFFETKLMGDLLQRIEDHRRIEKFLTSSSLTFVFSFFSIVIFGIVLVSYSLGIFLVFFCGTLLYVGWIFVFYTKRKELDYKVFEQAGRSRNVTYQLVKGMQEIKLQGCEQRKRWEWEDVQADLFSINLKVLDLEQVQQIGGVMINEIKNVIITVIAATAVIQGEMTLGMMLSVQYIIGQLNSPVDLLVQFVHSWQDVCISIDRMNEVRIESKEEDVGRQLNTYTVGSSDAYSISVNNLSFRYDVHSSHDTLSNINLYIPNGKVTAIVGASGSGKTTLIKLLLGFYEPLAGDIKVGDNHLNECSLSWWRGQCGAVMQEGYLFSDSIARNIAISDDEPDIERIWQAAQVAHIADYIEALPLGYNTVIGQDGQGISQGQRQRILIARVVYKNPMFVFLDEATNSLDAYNERAITESLYSFYAGKTVVVVAHRLSTVRNADQIVVLDQGSVVEIGTHDELIAKRGSYFHLVKNQLELGN